MEVDLDIMAASADKVAAAIEEAHSILTAMGGDVGLLFSIWAGQAADAHADMHERFNDAASVILQSLGEMHGALQQTRQIYVAQEHAQQQDHVAMSNQIAQ